MDEGFSKKEKLKNKILIGKLFSEGQSLNKFPVRLVYLPLGEPNSGCHKVSVSVPKRNFKKAVDRAHLKRLMREAYRKNKYLGNTEGKSFALMFIYVGKKKEDYHKITAVLQELLKRFAEKEGSE